jgi:redox-sensitive bicupin YhaK (pirin superfamily)
LSNLTPNRTAEECRSAAVETAALEVHPARSTELGALRVRRALPVRGRRMVGPWCFFDRYGPLSFTGGKPMDVAPHPHIGLQTVSWLLEGEIVHHDSLGCESLLRPGELNLMTAGSGIAHAEETPGENSGRLNGVQLWVALPEPHRNDAPGFEHARDLPAVEQAGGMAKVFMGELAGRRSPATAYSAMAGAEVTVHAGGRLSLPLVPEFEHAVMALDGRPRLAGQELAPDTLYYLGTQRSEVEFSAAERSRLLLIGGEPFGEAVLLWWNFVARSVEEIAAAREQWERGERFDEVRAYRGPRLAAPVFSGRPIPGGPAV